MNEMLTMDEIRSQFDSEWVLLDEPEKNDVMQVIRGKMLFHSRDRDEVHRKLVQLRPKHCALLYIGTMPEGTEILI